MPDDKTKKNSERQSDEHVNYRFYPLKPRSEEGFKKAVAWLGGREFIASLKGVIIYAIYGENMDPRSWMKPNIYPNIEEKIKLQKEDELTDSMKKRGDKSSEDVQQARASEEVNEDEGIQDEILGEVNQFWQKKIKNYWDWKRDHFEFWKVYLKQNKAVEKLNAGKNAEEPAGGFWFDYIADSGDGQMGVYGVACMCLSDLWLTENEKGTVVSIKPPRIIKAEDGTPKIENNENYQLLPRGYFMFVGGDTAYHSANYATLFERFQNPFRWAFTSVREFALKNYKALFDNEKSFFLLDGKKRQVFLKRRRYSLKKGGFQITYRTHKEWDGTFACEEVVETANNKSETKRYSDFEALRPIFGIPANHDYYDSIDGFNKQFRRPPFDDIEENMVYDDDKSRMLLQIPTFTREQEASYIALRLPFDWWMLGIDSEHAKLDYRQEIFFKRIIRHKPEKLIFATPEPTTVFGKLSQPNDKTATYLRALTLSLGLKQPFLNGGKFAPLDGDELEKCRREQEKEKQYGLEADKNILSKNSSGSEEYCRLDLSGDIHHYARYWGENTLDFKGNLFSSANYASVVAGGGGAFFDATETLIGRPVDADGNRIRKHNDKPLRGEIPPQKVYPNEDDSRRRTAERLFDLWNIKKGGYVQTAGAVFAVIIYSLLLHFSNASKIFEDLHKYGIGKYIYIPDNLGQFILYSNYRNFTPFIAGVILTGAAILTGMSVYKLNTMIEELKERLFEDTVDEKIDGRIKQMVGTFYPFFLAIVFYLAFLFFRPTDVLPFTRSYFLLINFLICGMLIFLSMDYSNWLPVRFKAIRRYKEKTNTQRFEDPNEQTNYLFLKLLGQLSREYSYKFFPAHLLVFFSVFVLISGIRSFGNGYLSTTFADLLLLTIVLGNLVMIIYMLAVKTGAAYYEGDTGQGKKYRGYFKKYRFYFWLLGTWHAALQILTPFIAYFYTNIYLALLLAVCVVVVNGLPITWERIKIVFSKTKYLPRYAYYLYNLTSSNLATKIMKEQGSRFWKTFFWVFYGSLFLFLPFVVRRYFPPPATVEQFSHGFTVSQLVEFISPTIAGLLTRFITVDPQYAIKVCFFFMSVAVVAYFGYYLSRVWFSWYLAISLLFNGHNNEAGGAARIEGFKHILRIHVQDKELTVYVIGFDYAKTDIGKLKLKLVDKFTLSCQPLEKS